MASIVRKATLSLFRKRRVKRNKRDQRTAALYDAGARLLARYDHDHVSMAKLAREAGCSVGALYNRFPDKESFLYHLSGEVFRSLREDVKVPPGGLLWPWGDASSMVRQIVSHVVQRMTTRKAAGVIRAAMKLAPTHPLTLELVEDYRTAATQYAVKILLPHVGDSGAPRVRVAMQIVLATVTDAILQKKPGPLQAGSSRMITALSNVMCGYLGIETDDAWAGGEGDREDAPEDRGIETEEEPETPPGHVSLYDPDLHVYKGTIEIEKPVRTRRSGRKPLFFVKSKTSSSTASPGSSVKSGTAPVPVVIPPRVLMATPEPEKPRRKRRWI
jgi:AcrR family transcriptional regulator